MDRHNQPNHLSTKAKVYRILTSLALLFSVCLYMPREESSLYQFEQGRPWRYNQLIATYDFPIFKSDEAIRREQDSLIKLYKPYFALSAETGKEQIDKFKTEIAAQRPAVLTARMAALVQSKLEYLYTCGVMSTEDYNNILKEDNIDAVRIYALNQSAERTIDNIFSHKAAYEFLFNIGPDSSWFDANLLRKYNIGDYIVPNLTYDKTKSEQARKDLLASVSYASGMVLSGQKIIDRGDIVDEKTFQILTSLEKEYNKRNPSKIQARTIFIGQLLFTAIIFLCLALYFLQFRRDYLAGTRNILFIASMPVIFPLVTSFLVKHGIASPYIIPFAIIPMFIRIFLDSRTAFITLLSTLMICAVTLPSGTFEFLAVEIIGGMTAIYSLRELSQRSQLIRSAFYVTIASLLFYFSMEIMQDKDLTRFDFHTAAYIVFNGILLLFAYPLLFLIEKIFSFTSNVTLVELSNTNNDLLRKLSELAPGTFQHSLQTANLATEVANKIGAQSLLVRTGALYHDIGKMTSPAYFIENQRNFNPHDRLSNEQSASIIIGHVKDGLKLADKYKLPTVIKNFIATHHGKGKTKYFYISYKNRHPNDETDDELFTYPGPNPFTLEQAILMMSDSVEAASRSLADYTEENIDKLVDKIIDGQVAEGFYTHCPITFQDIETAKDVFKEKLKNVYHTRIAYPTLASKPAASPK